MCKLSLLNVFAIGLGYTALRYREQGRWAVRCGAVLTTTQPTGYSSLDQ